MNCKCGNFKSRIINGNAIDLFSEKKMTMEVCHNCGRLPPSVKQFVEDRTTFSQPEIKIGQVWKHRKGNKYQVIHLANTKAINDPRFPHTVVYRSVIEGEIWTRPVRDWHRSFTLEA